MIAASATNTTPCAYSSATDAPTSTASRVFPVPPGPVKVKSRTSARRDRQLVEIAALIMSGKHQHARDLSFVHTSEFPADDDLLASFFRTRSDADD